MCCDFDEREEEVVREISLLLNLGREEANIADGGCAANEATGSSCLKENRSSAIMALILALLMRQSEKCQGRRWDAEDDDRLILFGG